MWIIPKNLHTSHYVPATAELISDLSELSQACGQSLLVRSKPMLAQTWLRKLKRDYWTRPLFGRILRPSLGKTFAEKWTSSLEASLVNPSQLQDVEKEMKTPVTFSHISREELSLLDLPLFSLRTSKESSLVNLQQVKKMKKGRPFCYMSLENWKDWVTEQRRAYLVRLKLGPPTREKESLSWVTARVGMSNAPAGGGDPLKKEWRFRLENQVQVSFPQEEEKIKNYGSPQELFPTPTATDHKYRLKGTSQASQNLNAVHKGKLNPRWVEALMGVPIGWTMVTCANPYVIELTSSDYLETEYCQQPPPELSGSYGKSSILLLNFVKIAEQEIRPFVRLDGLDSCIIGLNECCRIIYSYSKMIEHFNKYMTIEESIDWVLFNIAPLESPRSFDISYDLE